MDLARKPISCGKKPALVLIDVLKGFTDPSSPLVSGGDEVVAACNRLLAIFREKKLPVSFSRVSYDKDEQASVFRAIIPALETLRVGLPWNEIDERITPRENEYVFNKHLPSVFFKTSFADWLVANEVDTLVMAGMATSGCVRASAVDGLQYNYPVFVVEGACSDRNPEAHRANLHDLQAKYAEVVSEEKIATLLSSC